MIADMLERGVVTHSYSPLQARGTCSQERWNHEILCKLPAPQLYHKIGHFPLPRVDNSLNLLANTSYFTNLNLTHVKILSGRNGPRITAKDSILFNSGLYEFTVVTFSLCNAPAMFQRLIETVLAGLAWNKCFVYLNDILVVRKNFEEHLRNLQEVFGRLRIAGYI